MYFRTHVAIDLNALEYNYNNVRSMLPKECKLLGVIKANAYGHGAVEIGKYLDDRCDFFGVACIEEAIELKNAGIKTPLLVLGYVSPELYNIVVENDIRIPLFSVEDAEKLSKEADKQGKNAIVHLCIDTGMSRIGFQVNEDSADACKVIAGMPNIEIEGLFSHFATADEKDLSRAKEQARLFKSFVQMLDSRGVNVPIKHLNNSAGIMNFDECFDMCRMGIITYGLYPSEDVDKTLLDIKPVMSWLTHISHIKTLETGREVSYGGTYKLEEQKRVATVPVGYADGYPRCLSNVGRVIINGQYAKILGRVCMDQFMVDVTEIDDVEVGTKVTLVGTDGDAVLTMEEVSNMAHSFNYELPCRISDRVTRAYYKNGKLVDYVNYIY